MKWVKNKILIMALMLSAFALPASANAAVELRYVDAWQALNANSTFFNKTVAQLIDEEARDHNINPRLILTILQRESAAITQTTPSSTTRLAWPMFYMYNERMADCLNGDEASCSDPSWPAGGSADYRQRAYDFGGVGQQIAYSTYNFRNKATTYGSTFSTPISIDGQTITCANVASRVMYAYTPHLVSYDTASAFYTYWDDWWRSTPNGGAYDANNIISDANFSYVAMSVEEIETFLSTHGEGGQASWLANYMIAEYISVAYPAVSTPVTPPVTPPRKAGDANSDNAVDSTDLSILADQWGKGVTANTGADYNGDGFVDSTDLSILADAWGK